MGGDSGQRHQFLLNASRGMKGGSVLRLIEAASSSEEQKVSHPMLRMLGKLSQHAEASTGIQKRHALESIQEQVSDLVTGWTPEDPNPQEYTAALSEMSAADPDSFTARVRLASAEPRRVVDMAFEMDLVGDSVTKAVRQLIASEDASWLLMRIADNRMSALTQSLIGSTQEFGKLLQQLLGSEAVDPSVLDTLLQLVDITYIPTWAGFLYLAVVLDAWSRRVVGWAMATHLRTELVLDALNMALWQRRPEAVIHHSDR